MRGGLPHRPGYAVVPQLEPGAVRRAIALRGGCRTNPVRPTRLTQFRYGAEFH
jgi:hypothetical protein